MTVASEPTAAPRPKVSNLSLFTTFFQIGIMSLGGGATGWIHRDVVDRLQWLSHDDFLSGVAVSQILPGVNTTNVTVYVGQRLGGWVGAMTALTGFLFGPFWIAVLTAAIYHWLLGLPGFDAAMVGVAAVAVGMVLRVAALSAKRSIGQIAPMAVMLAAFVAVGVLGWPLAPVAIVLAPISIYFAHRRNRKDA